MIATSELYSAAPPEILGKRAYCFISGETHRGTPSRTNELYADTLTQGTPLAVRAREAAGSGNKYISIPFCNILVPIYFGILGPGLLAAAMAKSSNKKRGSFASTVHFYRGILKAWAAFFLTTAAIILLASTLRGIIASSVAS